MSLIIISSCVFAAHLEMFGGDPDMAGPATDFILAQMAQKWWKEVYH